MDFILVIVSTLGTSFVVYFFFSVLSLFAETLTGTATFGGFLLLAYSITALVSRPLAGMLTDKFGRVKILIIGAGICTVSCIMYVFSTDLILVRFTAGLVLLVSMRMLNAFGMSLNNIGAGAAIPDIVPKERISEGVGLSGMAYTIAQAIGPMVALAVIKGGEIESYKTLFWLSAGICAISLASGCFIKYESKQVINPRTESGPVTETEPEDVPEVKSFLGFESPVIGPALVIMILFFGLTSISYFLTLYGRLRDFNVEQLGWFFLASASGIAAARIFFGKIADRYGPDVLIMPGLAAIALFMFVIPFAKSSMFLIYLGLPYGLANGSVAPSINALMFRRCSPKRRGGVVAAYTMAIDIGFTFGAPIMGLIADHINFDLVYRLSSAMVIVALLVYTFFVSDMSRRHKLRTSAH